MPEPPIQPPPVMPGPLPSPPTAWPTVLGVIAIVFGCAGALQGVIGLLTPLFADRISDFVASAGTTSAPAFDPVAGVNQYRPWLVVSAIATLVAGCLLLSGGIILTMRKRSSRAVIVFWAAFKVCLVAGSSAISYQLGQGQLASMQQSGVNAPGMAGMMAVMSIAGLVIGVLWGWALPAFMLIWFMRRPVRAEIATWR